MIEAAMVGFAVGAGIGGLICFILGYAHGHIDGRRDYIIANEQLAGGRRGLGTVRFPGDRLDLDGPPPSGYPGDRA